MATPFALTCGLSTSLAIACRNGIVTVRDGFIIAETPSNPSYYFGNFLVFEAPPGARDIVRWPKLFARAFAHNPRVRHVAFAWSGESGAADCFADDGYTLQEETVLEATHVRSAGSPDGIDVRELQLEADWVALFHFELRQCEPQFEPAAYEQFMRRRVDRRRELCTEAAAAWCGAFYRTELVGACGIVAAEPLARYQDVGVDERFRNRGIAKALLAYAARIGFERFGAARAIIVANSDRPARALYERAGFNAVQREWSLWKAPQTNS